MQKFILFTLLVLVSSVISTGCESKGGSSTSSNSESGGDDDSGDSGGGGGTPPMTTQGNFRIIFVTDTEVNGTGVATGTGSGLTSFDALCASEMTSRGFGGQFKALIYTSNRRPGGSDWVLRQGKEYRRTDLTTVIDVAEHDATAGGVIFPMIANPLTNPITPTTSAKLPWTGFKNDWTADFTCSNWTRNDFDNTSDTFGTYGKSSINTDTEYIDLGFTQYWGGPLMYNSEGAKLQCDSKHPVYCVQTKQLPPSGAYKILFMSTTSIDGTQGIPAMDAVCAADAVTKGLSGTYKAVVVGRTPDTGSGTTVVRRVCDAADCAGATGTEQSVDWVLLPNTNYRRDDLVTYIGQTNEHGYFEAELEEPIAAGGAYWSGMTNGLAIGAGFQTCNGWSDAGLNGWVNEASGYAAQYGSSTQSCSVARGVLCAQQ